ncbi:PREDICTED: uncharacterized protein LOC106313200 [Brassica oleracea var. oleracea]|uniref:uncharacterized protein LOC106313200 n=1 Tax=Brassica oleracea var. oleracea TaxID=109376 RepID=UPI0006A70A4C|nr:PREDICTED: uncharacterized protein LOC106313200 [Brassica oleracea var. oleracea]
MILCGTSSLRMSPRIRGQGGLHVLGFGKLLVLIGKSRIRVSPNFILSNPPPPLGRHSLLPRLAVRSAVTSVRSFNPFPSLRNTKVFLFALFLAKMSESILKAARY